MISSPGHVQKLKTCTIFALTVFSSHQNLIRMQKEIFQRLNRIDHLIRIKGTGTPSELADKIGMSERSTYEYIRLMKEFGAPVSYSRQRKSYYYQQDGTFTIRFLSE